MEALSAMTRAADPYRAGLELGDELASIQPEVVFLVTTIGYGGSDEILAGLRANIDTPNLRVIGNSGDGCYGSEGIGTHGGSALALSSRGSVDWRVFHARGVAQAPEAAARDVLNRACATERPSFLYIVCDFRTDAARIEGVLRDYPDIPIMGGLAADDDRLQESVIYVDDESIADGVALLAAYGPVSIWTRIANDMAPVGIWGEVNDADGTIVRGIDGSAATDFIERAIGKPVLRSDRAVICLRLEDPEQPGQYRLRSIVPDFAGPREHVGLFGAIREGERVQVCVPETSQLLTGVEELAETARDEGLTPAAALMVSCAGRKWFLGQQVEEEVTNLTRTFGQDLPITGFASFGEIGPQRPGSGKQTNGFHNMSLVVTLIGS